jgi:hypothetical protein
LDFGYSLPRTNQTETTYQKLRSCLLTVLALLAFAASVNAGQSAKEQPKTGTIIVYRPFSTNGFFAGFSFNLDHGSAMKVSNGCYYRLTVSPGDHVISHDHIFLSGQDPQKVQVADGQTVYFLYTFYPVMGQIFEVASDQAQAKETASKLKAQN